MMLLLLLSFSSCKKEIGFDRYSVTLDQLKGTWRGKISTFKNNELIVKTGNISLFDNATGNLLNGIFEIGQIHFLRGFMFRDGNLYFSLVCADSANPQCLNWDLGGYIYLSDENQMVIQMAGNECGPLGKQFVTYEGELILINPAMDPAVYYSFAQTGRSWDYNTTLHNGTECSVQTEILSEPSAYQFTIKESNDCGWPFTSQEYTLAVEPFKISVMAEGSSTDVLYTFYLDGVVGKEYVFAYGNDTTYVTLADADMPISVPGGSFKCAKYSLIFYSHETGSLSYQNIFLNRQYGFIRSEYSAKRDSTGMKLQVLTAKNF